VLLILAGVVVGGFGGVMADRWWRASALRGPADPTAYASWRHRVSHFRRLGHQPGAMSPSVVMLGDSLTEGAEWQELLGPFVANRGISGDTTGGLRARLGVSVPRSIRGVVIMIGANDVVQAAWRLEDSVANVSAILDALKGRRVILQSVLYTADDKQNARIDRLNAAYAELCRTGRCEWVDLNPDVMRTGRPTPKESLDGRHLTGLAYERWAEALTAHWEGAPR